MKKPLIVAACVAAAAVRSRAQQRAPQNESIRQEDLRADLFFLAGDSLRGRLTDTEENRAAADFIRSRFERMGLKGAAPNGSFFQPYNLMTATLGDPARTRSRSPARRRPRGSLRAGQEFYPHRFSASGHGAGPGRVRRLRHQRAAPRLRRLHRRRRRARSSSCSITSRASAIRTARSTASSRPSRRRCGARRWRRRRRARSAVLFVSDVHNHPGAANFEAAARNYWPEKPPHLLSYTLAAWADRIRIPVGADLAGGRRVAGRRQRQDARGARADRGNGARLHAGGAAGDARRPSAPRSTATSCRIATSSRCSKAAIRG